MYDARLECQLSMRIMSSSVPHAIIVAAVYLKRNDSNMSPTPFDFDPLISSAADNRHQLLQTCEPSDSCVPQCPSLCFYSPSFH